jgi:hypothetical protein
MTRNEIQEILQELETEGIIRATGEFRPDNSGVSQPVYVAITEPECLECFGSGEPADACVCIYCDGDGVWKKPHDRLTEEGRQANDCEFRREPDRSPAA